MRIAEKKKSQITALYEQCSNLPADVRSCLENGYFMSRSAHMRQVRKKTLMEHGGGCCPFQNRADQSWSFTAGKISRP